MSNGLTVSTHQTGPKKTGTPQVVLRRPAPAAAATTSSITTKPSTTPPA